MMFKNNRALLLSMVWLALAWAMTGCGTEPEATSDMGTSSSVVTSPSGGSASSRLSQVSDGSESEDSVMGGSSDTDTTAESQPDSQALLASPNGLQLVRKSMSTVELSWQHASDAVGFDVYRNDNLLASLSNEQRTFRDDTLNIGQAYQFSVQAVNAGEHSQPVSILLDNSLVDFPEWSNTHHTLTLTVSTQRERPLFNVDLQNNIADTVVFNVVTTQDFIIDEVGQIFLANTLDLASLSYDHLLITIRDGDGDGDGNSESDRETEYRVELVVELPSDEALSTVIGLSAEHDFDSPVESEPVISNVQANNGSAHIDISWEVSSEGLQYLIYRNGFLIGMTSEASFRDAEAQNNQFYRYKVIPLNTAGLLMQGALETSVISLSQFADEPGSVAHIAVSVVPDSLAGDLVYDLNAILLGEGDSESLSVSVEGDLLAVDTETLMVYLAKKSQDIMEGSSVNIDISGAAQRKSITLHLNKLSDTHLSARGANHEFFAGLSGSSIRSFTPDRVPERTGLMEDLETPSNIANNYGQRLTGYYLAQETGEHRFYLSSDDHGQFWLAPGMHSENKKLVAEIIGFAPKGEFRGYLTPMNLIEGQYYFFEGLHVEIGGSDHFMVGVIPPSGEDVEVITQRDIIPLTHVESLLPVISMDEHRLMTLDMRSSTLMPSEQLFLVQGRYDGQLDDSVWERSEEITRFVQEGGRSFDLAAWDASSDHYVAVLKHSPGKTERSNILFIPRL